jgi:DNA primase
MIKRHSIERVLDTAKIEDIVGGYVDLKRRGVNLLGLCPFHNEKTPSFTVSPAKNIYKCFGCGKGGNAVQFLMEHENFSFPEAIRFLAERYGVELEETERTPENLEKEKERDSLYIINDYAKDFFHDQLLNSNEGRQIGASYFKHRGYIQSTIEEFQLGYCPKSGEALRTFSKRKGLNLEIMKEMGLFTRTDRDMYRERVIFPIFNLSGKVLGFGARTLKKDKKTPKYLNSPETEIYSKSNSLYGIFQAKKHINKADMCYLVEGYTDVLTMYQSGIKNAVSSSGTALTEGQVRLVKRFSQNICLVFDGDEAGRKAAKRGLPVVLQQDMNLKIATLPEGMDPDSFVRAKGKSGFEQFVEQEGKDVLIQLLEWNYSNKNSPVEKSEGLREVLQNLSHISDRLKRAFYIAEISRLTSIEEEILHKEVNRLIYEKIKSAKNRNKVESNKFETQKDSPQSDYEVKNDLEREDNLTRETFKFLVKYGDREVEFDDKKSYVSFVLLENLNEVKHLIQGSLYRKLFDLGLEVVQTSKPVGFRFFSRLNDQQLVSLVIDLSEEPYELSKNWEDKYDYPLQTQPMPEDNLAPVIEQILLRFQLRQLIHLTNQNKARIRENISEKELLKIMHTQKHLDEKKQLIAKKLNSVII